VKFNPGDPVSFTNEKLEGKVLQLLPGNCCRVEIEDGFTLDVHESELVLRHSFLRQPAVKTPEKESAAIKKVVDVAAVEEVFVNLKGFHLLVIPQQAQVLGGNVQWWLYNGSTSDQLYACSVPSGIKKEKTLVHGLLKAGGAALVKEFLRAEFIERNTLMLRWITVSHEPEKSPVFHTRIMHPEEPALEQTDKKLPAPFCFTRYQLLEVTEPESLNSEDLSVLYAKFKPVVEGEQKKSSPAAVSRSGRKETDVFRQYGLSPSANEIDLHIEELTDDLSAVSSADMLGIQLDAFRKALDRALLTHQSFFTVIHGVGNGKLKAAIRSELSEQGFKFQDAPYEKYGSGATRILLAR
jgi:hypothetical protein